MASFPASASNCCSQTCPDPVVINIPGANGASGAQGNAGANGQPAYAFLTSSFVMPAELANVTIAVTSTIWMATGETVYIQTAGWFQIVTIVNSLSVTIKNLKDTANSLYLGNVAPGTVIATNKIVTPSGIQGPSFGAGAGGAAIIGIGSPQGAQLASPGQFYMDNTVPATPSLWIKMSGVATNTGWIQLIA